MQRLAKRINNVGIGLIDADLERPPGNRPAGQPKVGINNSSGLQQLTDEVVVVELQ